MPARITNLNSRRAAYQLRVTLLNINPPIWRRQLVPADMPLKRFHDVLQVSMGWQDCHLHQFIVGDVRYGIADPELDPAMKTEARVKVRDVLPKAAATIVYEYDFGDAWEHEIVLEEVLPSSGGPWPDKPLLPRCVAGERACPPENSGGYPGYAELMAGLNDSSHPDHTAMREWLGEDFDPEAFDLSAANFWLGAVFGKLR